MVKYYFENGNFVIESYDKSKTFSSFLPGIAGLKGIPMWTFYVNRGQAIASFGIQDKGNPILEFSPANVAYQTVSTNGFRTFLKINQKVIEPFSVTDTQSQRKMMINGSEISIVERNNQEGYEIQVDYFNIPNENYAALVRKVQLKNISEKDLEIEMIDGLTSLFPFGIDNAGYKAVGNLLRSWMEVYHLETNIAFYKLRASTSDGAEINEVTKGNFYVSFTSENELLKPIVDADLIFGYDKSMKIPMPFLTKTAAEILAAPQITANKVPCGFSILERMIKPNETIGLNTIIGHAQDFEHILNQKQKIVSESYIHIKQKESFDLIHNLTNDVESHTGNALFDAYTRQCFLDNLLRGGYPHVIPNKGEGYIYYLYSRKHGDLERDYNWFSITPEYYSQGNGNFRDANQNRRNDVLFNPQVGSYNIKTFMSLIQLDGYNPLSVNGSSFQLKDLTMVDLLVQHCFYSHHEQLKGILFNKFTPGRLVNYIYNHEVSMKVDIETMFQIIFEQSVQNVEANFGEGYWVDHFTYNMDLVDSYLQIFPDQLETLMFKDKSYRYFDSPVGIYPRDEKYVLNKENKVRQYGALMHQDQEKMRLLNVKLNDTNWLKTNHGKGNIYQTTLYVKLLSLGLIKFATLDPYGMGIEMEADKPGWNDAMNGLPGLFGSGVGETFELLRIIRFLIETSKKFNEYDVQIPIELVTLLTKVEQELKLYKNQTIDAFHYWDHVATYREQFRESIRFGIDGGEESLSVSQLVTILETLEEKIMEGLDRAKTLNHGIYPTYIVYEAKSYTVVQNENHEPIISHYGLPKVVVDEFIPRPLPLYLEAPARSLKVMKDALANKELHQMIQESEIYDKKLHMYKTSVSIDAESNEVGRIRAFTPGWLERESIFLHMTYKYLYGLLKADMYDAFFEAMKTNVIPFLKPEVYGRSVLENSSFIASSVNPNPEIHGQGFQARLSGSTAEFLSMWTYMMYGKEPFIYENGLLKAVFKPILPEFLFDKQNEISFKFLGKTMITYVNPNRVDTYHPQCKVSKMEWVQNNVVKSTKEGELVGEYAEQLRKGLIETIKVYFEIN